MSASSVASNIVEDVLDFEVNNVVGEGISGNRNEIQSGTRLLQ
ncbi:unnamed protein product [Haemonchus placei]|uniref:Sm domain-containing protein n=1 Tax=Haemonchus placei TaxID=6290 RepID=A0A0N4X5R0_HAEPC|nr:unnamed protein product [Haemonchus placei]